MPTSSHAVTIEHHEGSLGEGDPVGWATEHVISVLSAAGVEVTHRRDVQVGGDADTGGVRVVLAAADSDAARAALATAPELAAPDVAEAVALVRPRGPDGPIVVVASEPKGLAYGLTELADVAAHATPLGQSVTADDVAAALRAVVPSSERPSTPVRSIIRPYVSVVQDPVWFYDRDFWREYLTELAVDRVNRFQLAFGMQYNYGHHPASDNYFCFPYPFLFDVPGFDVRVGNLAAEERERNLATLRFVTDEAKRRGMHVQLGLWNHAYDQGEGSNPQYPIDGLTEQNHAAYSRAALARLLAECPAVDGLTLRVHYEGGIPEPDHEVFWREVFAATQEAGRPIELDLHAKGVDQALLDVALETGQRVVLGAKHWAEHWGLPYQQTTIRDSEKARKGTGEGLMAITAFERRFTRYGYGDFLAEDRPYDLLFRIWPGGQKVLLWGDPVLGAGYGRLSTLGGALGNELCEPLFFSGRKGTGVPGGHDPYADESLRLGVRDWTKYRYTYRVWGRLLYNPDAAPDTWQRQLRSEFGPAAKDVEQALGAASRVVPLTTVVHAPAASNNGYWPELYLDVPIAEGPYVGNYGRDIGGATCFAEVSSFDPSMFPRVSEYADDLVAGRRDGRHGIPDIVRWYDTLADTAETHLRRAAERVPDRADPTWRRLEVDVRAQAGLGRFFAAKFDASLRHALFVRTDDVAHLRAAVERYRQGRDAWAGVAEVTTGVYRDDLAFGDVLSERGHWAGRLPAIDTDLAALERLLAEAEAADSTPRTTVEVPDASTRRPGVVHAPATSFVPGKDLALRVDLTGPVDENFAGEVVAHYRHLNQGEDYQTVRMERSGSTFAATVPGTYTDSPYSLAYYFTVHVDGHVDGNPPDAWPVPGLDDSLANQPYHVVSGERAGTRSG